MNKALSTSVIQSQLTMGQLYLFDELNSTNEYLLTNCNTLSQGSVCITKKQTAGRGRRGRNWIAPKGNLNYSLIWSYPINSNLILPPLSLVVALIVIESLQQQGIQDLTIKWPNDIYHKGKKVAGVLIELKTMPPHIYLVMGIGINLAPISKENTIDQPVSTLFGYDINPNQLVLCLTKKLQQMLINYPQTGFKPYFSLWKNYDLFLQKEVSIITDTQIYKGISQGINEQGELILQQQNSFLYFSVGEVSLRKG
ncbi:biotin--[acetyl-CoA-carboxylase] ligase [Pasteurella atlantica]|uniref:Biotin--[acetyl-CoA-carboxylase] ligase n=2 Tax=Pasteurellaceae TaxID=712 RepID=A0ACC6HMX8_9PAST|nr:biotin--[acetyl-CoA-carboxylase] ligase [Pasteurella atlantica]MDP8052210.1 biotin--[acetyl-CoA-carboxylase] ligase [Pasteurella atlantica]MDP8099643.1 biotin--[acetyl-CoA-carboxylase] ligase [Pasteurella atlantica]MDP8105668.1 biotin--[acetyl-CoA-carboxylase] ligase [Pasteurella atlantica]MDP8107556.1 biotin--[acetyl-CoA-carboxylase] ligase [Pasteurella atlantica]MDP8117251.1 biotin--[acetyl-CoA-carboxylase] ligase [Pasteurella atlantica]